MLDRYTRHHISSHDIQAVTRVLRSDQLTQGHEVERFEGELADFLGGDRHVVAVSSGTVALFLALECVAEERISPARALYPAMTFVGVAHAVELTRMRHRLGDIDDAGLLHVGDAQDIDVVIPVHHGGAPVDVKRLRGILAASVVVIEDATHALGGLFPLAEDADAAVLSFHPAKQMTTGEGGAVVTKNAGIAAYIRSVRDHGREGGKAIRWGFNFRMTDIAAALGRSQLRRVPQWRDKRSRLVDAYRDEIERAFGRNVVTMPPASTFSAHHLFQILVHNRDAVMDGLKRRGIGTQVHYPTITSHPRYKDLEDLCPIATSWANMALTLPLFPQMEMHDVSRVVLCLRDAIDEASHA